MREIIPILLCGGEGTRLWPISTPKCPKAFIPMEQGKNGLQHMIELTAHARFSSPTIVGNHKHRALIEISAPTAHIITESAPKNTLASITLAALEHQSSDALLLILPTDIRFTNHDYFHETLDSFSDNLPQNAIGIFGIAPSHPSSHYGYIAYNSNDNTPHKVSYFHEKPDSETAVNYYSNGLLWNSGCFLASPRTLLAAIKSLRPDILSACEQCYDKTFHSTDASFNDIPLLSFDREIIEHYPHVYVQPYESGWKDIGTFPALYNHLTEYNHPLQWNDITLNRNNVTIQHTPVVTFDEHTTQHIGYYHSPIGGLTIILENQTITRITFTDDIPNTPNHPNFHDIFNQLDDYFSGKRTSFNLSVKINGTAFQTNVWKKLQAIPFGQTASYKSLAESINNPKAVRAVGLANNKNPLPIIIPCHRVIGSNGSLTGYAGGLDKKQWLLDHEQGKTQLLSS